MERAPRAGVNDYADKRVRRPCYDLYSRCYALYFGCYVVYLVAYWCVFRVIIERFVLLND